MLPCAGQQVDANPAIFAHWDEVFSSQTTPEALFGGSDEDEVDKEQREEAAEVRGVCTTALKAARELYSARLELLREGVNAPRNPHQNEAEKAEEAAVFLQTGEVLLVEGFRRDLEALSFSETWLMAGSVEPGTQPGRQELLYRPVLNGFSFEQVDGCNVEISCGYADLNTEWRKQQDDFMKSLHTAYGKGDEGSGRNPFTGELWSDGDDAATKRFRAGMQKLLLREQQAWERYREAMMELVCPSNSFTGSGAGSFMSIFECHLLNSRERFLCLLVAGTGGLDKLPRLLPERCAPLLELHPEHRFGEIFTCGASLFRHPKLEGNPWCIRFEAQGAGFIPVADGSALRRYVKEFPDGGELEVRGYQTIEVSGWPYVSVERKDGDGIQRTCPQGGLAPRQVFILQQFVAEADE